MNKRLFVILSLACCFCLFLAAAAAALPERTAVKAPAASLQRGDADRDGVLTEGEAEAYRKKRFQDMDANGDGKLSADEYAVGRPRAFVNRDTDKDGMVQVKEYVIYWCGGQGKGKAAARKGAKTGETAGNKAQFQRADGNGDGKIKLRECYAFYTIRFKEIDKNGDGVLSREEIAADTKQRFEKIDVDKDGAVTWEEYRSYWIKR